MRKSTAILRDSHKAALAIALGVLVSLAMRGYQFGRGNHNVYLPAAVRLADPAALRSDWWLNSSLQYHGVFTWISAALMRAGSIEGVFAAGYLGLAVLLHIAWLRIVRLLGGGVGVYLLSVTIYYASAGGIGLGMYCFLQDGSMLPSNIANVAMLWGLYWIVAARPMRAALALGVAGMFHLNHAIGGGAIWAGLMVWALARREVGGWREWVRLWLLPGALLGAMSLLSVVPAMGAVFGRTGRMPLHDFVDLYVKLRHPHHYAPFSWGWPALWVALLWPVPLAILALRGEPRSAVSFAFRVCAILGGMLFLATLLAGVWFVHESVIQLSLWRFSIYLKLFTSIGAAYALLHIWRLPRGIWIGAAVVLGGTIGAAFYSHLLAWRLGQGITLPGLISDDRDYLRLCEYVRQRTPTDAIFLVPPDEQDFRLHARRAIVVNFKGVPQLSGELIEWRTRLQDVLDMPDLRALPTRFDRTLAAIGNQYERLPGKHLVRTARKYGAIYVVTSGTRDVPGAQVIHTSGRYRLHRIVSPLRRTGQPDPRPATLASDRAG